MKPNKHGANLIEVYKLKLSGLSDKTNNNVLSWKAMRFRKIIPDTIFAIN